MAAQKHKRRKSLVDTFLYEVSSEKNGDVEGCKAYDEGLSYPSLHKANHFLKIQPI